MLYIPVPMSFLYNTTNRLCSPGQVPPGMHSDINEQRAKDEQVGPIINSILYQCCFNLPSDREASRAGIRLHKWQ